VLASYPLSTICKNERLLVAVEQSKAAVLVSANCDRNATKPGGMLNDKDEWKAKALLRWP
jgi:hypothetical protein